ncbi:MAG: ribosome-associated translation inhibitor RaiA [Deltaproteobacteria bacterium]|nr:ribosome-associated translation inhibitor RaiA [Deltaproteobacteria bacterium]
MTSPVQITFRGIQATPHVEELIHEEAGKLMRLYDRITDCRVVVDQPHRHHRHGRLFQVKVQLTVPGDQLVAARAPDADHSHEELTVAVRGAFEAARRELQRHLERRRDLDRSEGGAA